MTTPKIAAQYATGMSRQNIERALLDAGKDLDHLTPADLGPLEDFHTMGRYATGQLVDLVRIGGDDKVLDAGTGIGGTARLVADRFGCQVTAVDLTEEFCETSRWLNHLVGLDDVISVQQADVTELPFRDATFDVVFSQHVQMNVADKPRLYREARRVLVDDGVLAIWDIAAGSAAQPDYPLPWADRPAVSHLASPDQLRSALQSAGFTVEHWNDKTEEAAELMRTMLTMPPNPLGLHAFVSDFAQKATHLTGALSDGRLRAIQGVARAITE
jgi:sarcosine/dimethylglycine N-methyltransferase